MKLSNFGFLADENISNALVQYLRSQQLKVFSLREEKLIGSSDESLVKLAEEKELVIVTHDSDFGKITFVNNGMKTGVIFLKPGHINPQFPIQTIKELLSTTLSFSFPFMLVAERVGDTLKVRKRLL